MRKMVLAAAALLALVLSSAGAMAQTKVEIAEPWARATIGQSRNTAAYMKMINRGTEPDRLVRASTPAAAKAELHTTLREGTVMRMRELKSVELKPGEAVAFAPGGMHVMLIDVEPLRAGGTITLTLEFEKAGKQEVTVPVRQGPAQGGHQH
jgi:copper(I)-binding protein